MNTDDERREEYTRKVLEGGSSRIAGCIGRSGGGSGSKALDGGAGQDDTVSRSDLLNVLNGSVLCMFEPTNLNDLRRENSIQFCSPLTQSDAYESLRRRMSGVPIIGCLLEFFSSSHHHSSSSSALPSTTSPVMTPMAEFVASMNVSVPGNRRTNDYNPTTSGALTNKTHDPDEITRISAIDNSITTASPTTTTSPPTQPMQLPLPSSNLSSSASPQKILLAYSIESLNQSGALDSNGHDGHLHDLHNLAASPHLQSANKSVISKDKKRQTCFLCHYFIFISNFKKINNTTKTE